MTAEELNDPARFARVWGIDHARAAADLAPWMRRRSVVSGLYLLANLLAVGLAVGAVRRAGLPAFDGFADACLGAVLGYVLLVPVHEAAHALAYRALGARAVRVRYHWRTLTAECVADRFVTSGRQLAGVALAPFLVLNPVLAAGAALLPGVWGVLAGGALVLHTVACSGDFALVNWVWLRGRAGVWTYDDLPAGRSYFFAPAAQQ